MDKFKRHAFTLVELIIVIVVIGVLAALAVPKFTGIQRDGHVSVLYRDLDTIEKVIPIYDSTQNSLPIKGVLIDRSTLNEGVQTTMAMKDDIGTHLYEIDLDKLNGLTTPLRYGNKKLGNEDYYIYSQDTNTVYYVAGIMNSKNEMAYCINKLITPNNSIKNGQLNNMVLDITKINTSSITTPIVTGTIPKNDILTATVNGVDISGSITYGTPIMVGLGSNNTLEKIIYAGEMRKPFSISLNMVAGSTNLLELKVPETKVSFHYSIKVDSNYPAPTITVDATKNPPVYNMTPPSGVSVSSQEWQLDGGTISTSAPTSILTVSTHTVKVRIKDAFGKYSDWATKTFNAVSSQPIEVSPRLTSNNTPSPYSISASSAYGSYQPYEMFDNIINPDNNVWCTNYTRTGWFMLDFGNNNSKKINKYTIYVPTVAYPTAWTFQGSNDNVTWNILDTQNNITWATVAPEKYDTRVQSFSFTNSNSYRYYKLNVTTGSGSTLQITEMKLFE